MLEKLKELFLKRTSELLGTLLTLLFGTIFWQIIPLLLSPLWTRLSPPTLQRILGLSLLSVMALLAYTLTLHRKLKTKLRIQFGLYWDRHGNPFCPACRSLVTGYTNDYIRGPIVACVKCDSVIAIRDDDGQHLVLRDARNSIIQSFNQLSK